MVRHSGFRYVVGISLVLAVGATTSAVAGAELEPQPQPQPQPQSQPEPLSSPVEVASGWSVDRVGERDRYSTAAKVSERFFTAPASTVFVANGEGFADALAGGAAAGLAGAPLLLTARDQLPAVTAAEINRLNPERVVLLGGPNAVSSAVEQGIGEGRSVVRLSGATRYSTAVEISKFQFPGSAPVVFIANGENFADGLAGGPSAATRGGPLLLVLPDALPAEVAAEIQRLGARDAVVLGGANAVSASVVGQLEALGLTVNRRAGSDRYGTAVSITSQSFTTAATAVLVTGANFPDALTSGSLAKRLGAPLLLTRTDCMPAAVIAELQRLQVSNVLVVGGTGAVSPGSATGTSCPIPPPAPADVVQIGNVTVYFAPDAIGLREAQPILDALTDAVARTPTPAPSIALFYSTRQESIDWAFNKTRELNCLRVGRTVFVSNIAFADACGFAMRIDMPPTDCPARSPICKTGAVVAAHEYRHIVDLQRLAPCPCTPLIFGKKIPTWYNEGVADYVGYQAVYGADPQAIPKLLVALRDRARHPDVAVGLAEMEVLWARMAGRLTVEFDLESSNTLAYLYERSFFAVALLVEQFGEESVLNGFHDNIVRTGHHTTGFEATFGKTIAEFDLEFQAWIAGL